MLVVRRTIGGADPTNNRVAKTAPVWRTPPHSYVARIGAKAVANIPTLVHEPGTSLVGAGPGASAPGLPGLPAQTGGGDHGGGGPYRQIR